MPATAPSGGRGEPTLTFVREWLAGSGDGSLMSSRTNTVAPWRSCHDERDLASLRDAAASCRGCDLWQESTQVVFGEGPADAEIVLVGEQPGRPRGPEGHPFVGPAGGCSTRASRQPASTAGASI